MGNRFPHGSSWWTELHPRTAKTDPVTLQSVWGVTLLRNFSGFPNLISATIVGWQRSVEGKTLTYDFYCDNEWSDICNFLFISTAFLLWYIIFFFSFSLFIILDCRVSRTDIVSVCCAKQHSSNPCWGLLNTTAKIKTIEEESENCKVQLDICDMIWVQSITAVNCWGVQLEILIHSPASAGSCTSPLKCHKNSIVMSLSSLCFGE